MLSSLIIRLLCAAKRQTNMLDPASQNRSRQNANTAVYIVSGILSISLLTVISNLIMSTVNLDIFDPYSDNTSFVLYVLALKFTYINNVVNLFIFLISSDFRNHLKQLLCPHEKCVNRTQGLDVESNTSYRPHKYVVTTITTH